MATKYGVLVDGPEIEPWDDNLFDMVGEAIIHAREIKKDNPRDGLIIACYMDEFSWGGINEHSHNETIGTHRGAV